MTVTDKQLKNMVTQYFNAEVASEIRQTIEEERRDKAQTKSGFESILTSSLTKSFYTNLKTGEIQGLPSVTWVGFNEFIFTENSDIPFLYKTSADLKEKVIQPERMVTDGGSIPQMLKGFTQQFSSWGYAPAFIIHDWVYEAQTKNGHSDQSWTFENSALIMAEIMKTMMEKGYADLEGNIRKIPENQTMTYLMYLAVSSRFAKKLWPE